MMGMPTQMPMATSFLKERLLPRTALMAMAATRKPRLKPPVGPINLISPDVPPTNTGTPTAPSSR